MVNTRMYTVVGMSLMNELTAGVGSIDCRSPQSVEFVYSQLVMPPAFVESPDSVHARPPDGVEPEHAVYTCILMGSEPADRVMRGW